MIRSYSLYGLGLQRPALCGLAAMQHGPDAKFLIMIGTLVAWGAAVAL
jgi:hypothetical protein